MYIYINIFSFEIHVLIFILMVDLNLAISKKKTAFMDCSYRMIEIVQMMRLNFSFLSFVVAIFNNVYSV